MTQDEREAVAGLLRIAFDEGEKWGRRRPELPRDEQWGQSYTRETAERILREVSR